MARGSEAVAAGRVIGGKYELVEPAGRGGMATVWRATVSGAGGFQRTVAVKQMHPHLCEQPAYVDMFFEEARVGAALNDANIPQVYDCVEDGGNYYIVMEWVEGIDLGSYIKYCAERGTKARWELVTAVGIGMLRGLAAAHERVTDDGKRAPIVHRDVSPHNVLLDVFGRVKLIDFGLSLARDRGKDLTEPGVVKGKISYLSPGVVAGARPTPATDQFAAGTVLWEALVGRRLFDGATDFEVYKKMREAQIQPLRPLRPDVPKGLVAVVMRALSANEADRYPSVREMARQLALVLKEHRARRDLHVQLGREVVEARANLAIGRRTHDPADETPIQDVESAQLTPVEGAKPGQPQRRGLLHWLPWLGKAPRGARDDGAGDAGVAASRARRRKK
ncbi:MAG: serine/threonine protein kinase [Deltaproteobacteria bacterium]|nr:MAG: serine/threonine protein kinase [Deltaproteobacteria bacterium]